MSVSPEVKLAIVRANDAFLARNAAARQTAQERADMALYRESQSQVEDAIDAINRPASAYKRMPWRDLDALVGGLAPATLWYVVMLSGNGKTTFFASFAEEMLRRGDRVYVMATESTPHVFRTHLACRQLGVSPGDLLSGEYLSWPNNAELREAVVAEMETISRAEGDAWRNLTISTATHFGSLAVERAAIEAHNVGADWFLVDHVDHLEAPQGMSEYSVSYAANAALFAAKNEYGFRVLASSQVNHQVTKGNPFAYFTPPQDDWIKFGSHKKEKADGVITGCRALRFAGVDKDTLAAFRDRKVKMADIAEPGVMTVSILKHRLYGERIGSRCHLRIERGRVLDMDSRDTSGYAHGIRTARGF